MAKYCDNEMPSSSDYSLKISNIPHTHTHQNSDYTEEDIKDLL